MPRPLHLNAVISPVGGHDAAWRRTEAAPHTNLSASHYVRLAKAAERGLFDAVFLADVLGIIYSPGRQPLEALDPVVKLTAIAAATQHIGLIATASTSFESPYNIARRFASLDIVSGGRAGWNIVTSYSKEAGPNYGIDDFPSPEARYAQASEFVDVVLKLWDSWEHDALVVDKQRGVYADPSKVHRIDHVGEHYSVRGPALLPPTPQGRPILAQAGSSGPGIELGARHADVIFTAQSTIEKARAFSAELKSQARAHGRCPEEIAIMPGVVTTIGATEAEAQRKERDLDALIVLDHQHAQLAEQTGVPLDELHLDKPLPQNIRRPDEIIDVQSRYELMVNIARRDNLTVRELLIRLNRSRGHLNLVGTPEQIADTIQYWHATGACDGFNVIPSTFPEGLDDFVDGVVPILQQRGVFRTEYSGITLRDHYGLPERAEAAIYV